MIYLLSAENMSPIKLSNNYKNINLKDNYFDLLEILKKTNHPNPKQRLLYLLDLKDTHCVGQFYKTKMLGFACFKVLDSKNIKLEQIAVLPQIQNQGVGKNLMRSYSLFTNYFPDKYWLEVRSENFEALEFYKKQGFKLVRAK